ncbi:MAG: hypothetical protein SOV71_00475 [Anaerovoracaceae bacterium]|nr:ATPase [Bacillota bacterium]MDY2670021.1 hypothetical protein [Anaerovoracaceae bacterium]
MKIIDLLQEIEDILNTSGNFPLSSKVIVDPEDILDILHEIKDELPKEIQQAQWIKDERQRILDEAKAEYDRTISIAKEKADQLVEQDDITLRAKKRADDIMRVTEENVRELKTGTFEYIDQVLASFQEKIDDLNENYAQRMYEEMADMFGKMSSTLDDNRNEIRTLSDQAGRGDIE